MFYTGEGCMATKQGVQVARVLAKQGVQVARVLAVDVGNQVTHYGLFEGDELFASWSATTPPQLTTDEAMLSLSSFMKTYASEWMEENGGVKTTLRISSILSCVVPSLMQAWLATIRLTCNQRPLLVGPGLKTGLRMNYHDPSELGSDRIADMVAAKKLYGYPLIIIDCGTVINFQVLDSEGQFIGGLIFPGLTLSARSLSQAAERLPVIDLEAPTSILGKNTRGSMQSGIMLGEIARLDGLIEMIWHDLGYVTDIVLSGEDSELLAPLLDHEVLVDSTLTLKGLNILFHNNRKPTQ